MEDTLFLTRRRNDGMLRSISGSALNSTNNPPLPSFLQEVDLGRSKACFFKNGVTPNLDNAYYELTWMKIPAMFEYIAYEHDDTQITDVSTRESIGNTGILTPLLLFYEVNKLSTNHICSQQNENIKISPTWKNASEGCSIVTKHLLPNTDARPFELFYYTEGIRTEVGQEKLTEKPFFLISLMLTERVIVYYAIEDKGEGIPKDLQTWYRDSLNPNKPYAEIKAPLILSEGLGIFISTKVVLENPVP